MTSRRRTISSRIAIAVVLVVAALTAVAAQPAEAITNCSPSSSWGTNRADLASQVIGLINQHRAGMGLSQLAVSSPLTASSEWKSLHMAEYGYFAHDDQAPPVARTAHQRVLDCGYGGSWWGENIAWGYGSAQSVVDGWLGSSGHKANIENPNFSSTGVGVAADSSGRLYWTQSFGNDVAGTTPTPAPAPPVTQPAPTAPLPTVPTPSAPTPTAPAAPGAGAAGPAPAPAATQTVATPLVAMRAHVTRGSARSRLTASVAFVERATGQRVTEGSVRCFAEVDGRRLRVVANAFKAKAALCAWRVPAWANGKKFTGVVAVQVRGTATKRLFVRTLGRP